MANFDPYANLPSDFYYSPGYSQGQYSTDENIRTGAFADFDPESSGWGAPSTGYFDAYASGPNDFYYSPGYSTGFAQTPSSNVHQGSPGVANWTTPNLGAPFGGNPSNVTNITPDATQSHQIPSWLKPGYSASTAPQQPFGGGSMGGGSPPSSSGGGSPSPQSPGSSGGSPAGFPWWHQPSGGGTPPSNPWTPGQQTGGGQPPSGGGWHHPPPMGGAPGGGMQGHHPWPHPHPHRPRHWWGW